jgi:hypothetical protein
MQTYDIDILDYIRTGHDRAITRAELSDLTGIDDRTIRDMIHYARRDIPILNMQDGRGYFVPDMNILEERMMLMKYIRQEESRLKSIGWALKTARRTAKNCNMEVDTDELKPKNDCRRGQQFCGSNGDADVVGLPGIHIECKRVEKLNIYEAVEQSINDAREGEMPTVMHRKNHKDWLVTMTMEDWMKLYEKQRIHRDQ